MPRQDQPRVWMKTAGVCAMALATLACSAASRHKALTTFFDGVPPLEAAQAGTATPASATASGPSHRVQGSEHGPYAAKLCGACHEAGSTNALVAPRDELCARCHTIGLDRAFVHGPLASGGCLVCHDPHSSRNRYLLVSDAGTFCLGCHDPESVAKIDGHGDLGRDCTGCHDAHGSDAKYFLR